MNASTIEFAINDDEGLTHVFLQDPASLKYWAFAKLEGEEYEVEKDEQSFADSGGILAVTLSSHALLLSVSKATAYKLQCLEEEVINLPIDPEKHSGLCEALKLIFGEALRVEL